jgi:hypothetical protein
MIYGRDGASLSLQIRIMKNKNILIIGDILALAIVTVIGFTTHGEANTAFLPRMAAALIPICIAWFLIAPWLGLFDAEIISAPRMLWRPALALLFAGPLAVVVRGLILNATVIPIFAVVLSSTSALGMIIWRWIYILIAKRYK